MRCYLLRVHCLITAVFPSNQKVLSYNSLLKYPVTSDCRRCSQVHAEVLERVTRGIVENGYELVGTTESPIKGDKSGNTEFLAYFIRRPELVPVAEVEATAAEVTALIENEEEAPPCAGA